MMPKASPDLPPHRTEGTEIVLHKLFFNINEGPSEKDMQHGQKQLFHICQHINLNMHHQLCYPLTSLLGVPETREAGRGAASPLTTHDQCASAKCVSYS